MRIYLQEGRTIKTSQDAIDLLNNGKLAGRLGGKRFVPQWLSEQSDIFANLVDLTLSTIGEDPNIAGDEVVQFMIKCSPTGPEKWLAVIENCPDTLVELSKAFAAQWFAKSEEWQSKLAALAAEETFNQESWHNLEKEIQDAYAKRAAKKHKSISNTNVLYDTLYEDQHWKLCVPKSFEGDIELASHIKPFGRNKDSPEYTKTRWCTAASKDYYDRYTHQGKNKLYVIQYYSAGVYKEAWQLAFDTNHIEFMDKNDDAKYSAVRRSAPAELLEKIICDAESCIYYGWTLKEMWDLIDDNPRKLDSVFNYSVDSIVRMKPEKFVKEGDCWLSADRTKLVSIERQNSDERKTVFKFPESVDGFMNDNIPSIISRDYKTVIVTKKLMDRCAAEDRFNIFDRWSYVEKVQIEEGTLVIPKGFLERARNLRRVSIPSTVTVIQESAFEDCEALRSITLPEGLIRLEDRVFEGSGIEEINLPSTLQVIGDSCFQSTHLENVVVPSSVQELGGSAFKYCENLETIELPEAIPEIGTGVFYGCSQLQSVTNMQQFADIDNSFEGCSLLDLSVLEGARTRIVDNYYKGDKDLHEFIMEDRITEIGSSAFAESSIEKIVFGAGLEKIEYSAFQFCRNLKVVDFSKVKNLKVIEKYAFKNSGIESVILPESITSIGYGAFSNCRELSEVIFTGDNLKRIEDSAFDSCEKLTHIELPDSIRRIGEQAFADCTELREVKLPARLHYLGQCAFKCTKLQQVTLPRRISTIPERCFQYCKELENVKFSTNVAIIERDAFEYCRKLANVEPYGADLEDYDVYEDVSYCSSSFSGTPFEEVLIAAGVIDEHGQYSGSR